MGCFFVFPSFKYGNCAGNKSPVSIGLKKNKDRQEINIADRRGD